MDTPDQDFEDFEFAGTAVHRAGWRTPVHIRVGRPFSDRPGEFVSFLECALFQRKPHPVRAGSAQHAYAIAFRLVRSMLSDFSFEDRLGNPVLLPRIPPEEDDWNLNHHVPDQGFGTWGVAVDCEGGARDFYIGVSAPKPTDSNSTEVYYGARGKLVEIVQGSSVNDAFYNGIELIEARLDSEGLVLLDIWNMPLKFPKRPKP